MYVYCHFFIELMAEWLQFDLGFTVLNWFEIVFENKALYPSTVFVGILQWPIW
jgi:hypothetical protein